MPDDWKELVALAEREVAATLQALPAPLRGRARALPITYEPWPSEALVEDGVDPDTLGLFVGGDYVEAGQENSVLPAQIILFLKSILDLVEGDEAAFRAEVRTTLLHELGHYLGLGEDDLEDRGLE